MTGDGTCQSRICPASSRGMSAAPKPRRARFDSGVGHSAPVSASGRPAGFEPVDGCSIRPTGTIPPRVAQWQCSCLMSGRREFDSHHVDRGRSQVARRKAVNLLSWVRFPPVTPYGQRAGRGPVSKTSLAGFESLFARWMRVRLSPLLLRPDRQDGKALACKASYREFDSRSGLNNTTKISP
jgi:hypothetical protein